MGKTTSKFAPEVRERAVRIVLDHEADHPSCWAAIVSISEKYATLEWIDCFNHRRLPKLKINIMLPQETSICSVTHNPTPPANPARFNRGSIRLLPPMPEESASAS